ncbi:MAG: 2,3-bisphosphoglycerate-independent phosphoglycerate mutase [Clostridiales bacterium]|nr:2,3-bisphosphoglycerate-independent phosphoglycerate mutase [Clostridiales bacterium]
MNKKLTALVIMDGYGLYDQTEGNAIKTQGSENVCRFMNEYPCSNLNASGMAVGLPEGQMGNSEVGHLNIGAGRVIYQELTRITKSISDGDFFENKALLGAVENCKKTGGKLHLMGLTSDGGVHSHMTHIFALIELAKRQGLDNVYVHCYLDGRDVHPTSGYSYVKQVCDKMAELEFGKVATVCGRMYAMDRDNRWERVVQAYDMLTLGVGEQFESPLDAIQTSYDNGVTDEFMLPKVIVENGKPVATIENGDSVVFFNFRPDRAREMTRAFTQPGFNGFDLEGKKRDVHWVCMTQYDESFVGVDVAYRPESHKNTLGEYLANNDMTQVRIAETEKYAHVTFFFNGGVEKPNENEDRVLVPSKKEFATYDLVPEMSAYEVTEKALAAIESGKYDAMILNYANCDMVGHTGIMDAAIKAVKAVDDCVNTLVNAILAKGGRVLLTADHGNAETMFDKQGNVITSHSTNPVPLVLIDNDLKDKVVLENGALCDIAPTMLYSMGMPIPQEMTGKVLIKQK